MGYSEIVLKRGDIHWGKWYYKKMDITTWQAHKKYDLSTGYLRYLLANKSIKGREAPITSRRKIWLIDENSLKKFLKKDRRPGPKPSKSPR